MREYVSDKELEQPLCVAYTENGIRLVQREQSHQLPSEGTKGVANISYPTPLTFGEAFEKLYQWMTATTLLLRGSSST
ncbi:unnamed protein product [Thlaspi arvense]|uniref:Uncharacterized protein n=1 Tax=Thlaspi arvense TaxID=13288 RepID=A0AAU9SGE9_THLAR|nr:unnamed protein product [Thlaspi arvense]